MLNNEAFTVKETHGILARRGVEFLRSSEHLGWRSIYASIQRENPFSRDFDAVDDQLIVWHRNGPVHIAGEGGGRRYSEMMPPDSIHLIPGGATFSVRLEDRLETMHVYVRQAVLRRVACEICGRPVAHVQIEPRQLYRDIALQSMLTSLGDALEPSSGFSIFEVDYIARAIAAYLVRRHSNLAGVLQTEAAGGGDQSASPILPFSVRNAVAYMRRNLERAMPIHEIADSVRMSVGHLTREFRTHLGLPPHQYLIKLRVEQARELLLTTNLSIATIAFDCGFTHQEHLTRHFKRELNFTPASFRRQAYDRKAL
jgi:AraC family transcriptional regulator